MEKNVIKFFIMAMICLCCCGGYQQTALAATKADKSEKNNYELSLNKLKYTSNGANISVENETNAKTFQIRADKNAVDYSTPILFWNQQIQSKSYGEFDVYMKNQTDKPIKMNLNLTSKVYGNLSPLPGSYAVGEISNTKEQIFLPMDAYGFEIPENFEGTIRIPFYIFVDTNSNSMVLHNLGILSYIGITVVCKSNSSSTFRISNPCLIPLKQTLPDTTIAERKIIGEDIISRPSYGKVFTNYNVQSYDMLGNATETAAKFYLKYQRKGIDVSTDGKVVISSNANAQKMILAAKIPGEDDLQKEIAMKNSWTVTTRTKDGYNASVPTTDEVKKISENKGFFYSDTIICVFWILCICAGLILSAYYIYHRHPDMFNKKKQ